jgi:hypothetical protein
MAALVTILTRTLGRPCLADAAASVAAQTYRPIEWLVVDAAGKGIEAPPAGDAEVRVVGSGAPMLRARAANFGFRQARGARLILLDDDDLLLPRGVELLSAALDANPAAKLAYGDVTVETQNGPEFAYRYEYSELALLMRNLFPPNAALFDLALVRDGAIAFDEDVNWFDDWDLWLKVSERTTFVHVREFTGIYRLHLSQSGVWTYDRPGGDPRIRRDAATVAARYASRRLRLRRQFEAAKDDARQRAARGDLAGAAQAWLGAHLMLPADEEPVLGYAGIALAAGDRAAATRTLRGALAAAPGSEALSRMLASILEEQGNAQGARAVLQRAADYRAAALAAVEAAAPMGGPVS